MTKTKLCPACKGVGLIETAIGGHWCRECKGTGKVPDQSTTKGVGPTEKSPLRGGERREHD
jgi:DnaJ-class molecular chaperone